MSESNFTPEELNKIELDIPAFQRKHKIQARRDLRTRLEKPDLAGGISSPLNPIQPHKLKEFGEPTVPLKKEEIKPPGKN